MTVSAIPSGYHSITPYLVIKNATEAIEFYKKAFNAKEVLRLANNGHIGHAEILIGDSHIMFCEEMAEMGFKSPTSLGGAGVSMALYVENVDASFQQAINAGAKEVRPVEDQFYGDRSGTLVDPYGHVWTIATHKEDLSPEELQQRFDDYLSKQQQCT